MKYIIGYDIGGESSYGYSDDYLSPFKITVNTAKTGSTSDTFILPLFNGEYYDFIIKWGDDSEESVTGASLSSVEHQYPSSGTYQISIIGQFPRIYFNNSGDRQKVLSIDSWGSIIWSSMSRAFLGCVNLTCNYYDSPNLSKVTDTSFMFYGCAAFNCTLIFDTRNIVNMTAMFAFCPSLKQRLSSFNIENVANMTNFLTGGDVNEIGATSNYDYTLISWANQVPQNGIVFDGGDSKYSLDGKTARDILINEYGWVISDGGLL